VGKLNEIGLSYELRKVQLKTFLSLHISNLPFLVNLGQIRRDIVCFTNIENLIGLWLRYSRMRVEVKVDSSKAFPKKVFCKLPRLDLFN